MLGEKRDGSQPLRVCYFGTYRAKYTRNQLLLKGLRANGVELFECHAQLWRGIEDRVQMARGGWRNGEFFGRVLRAYHYLWQNHATMPPYDVMVIGYPGQFDAFLGSWLAHQRKKPVVLDVLMSLHLVAEERQLTGQNPFTSRLLFQLERFGLHRPNYLLMENRTYQSYVSDKYDLPASRFRYLPHGADDTVYRPRPQKSADGDSPFRVIYFGGFLRSHGVPTMIRAAYELRDRPDIQFEFFGEGPEAENIRQLASELGLNRLIWHGFVPMEQLLDGIAQADLCLGVFGTTLQAQFTVQNKIWESLAMQKTVISAESPAIRELLTHNHHLYLVPRDDPKALAEGIVQLSADPLLRAQLAQNGYNYYRSNHSTQAIGAQFKGILQSLAFSS